MVHRSLANVAITDLDRAEEWYARLFDRGPDDRPMAGLIEWHLGDTFGRQVWSESDRAGWPSVVLDETDLDAAAEHALQVGIPDDGPEPGGGACILPLTDPDGNQVVLTGT